VHVWSTGNLRINTRDMMLNADDAVDLLAQIRQDTRVSTNGVATELA